MQEFRKFRQLAVRLLLGIVIAVGPVCLSFDWKSGLHAQFPMAIAASGSGKGGDGDGGKNSGSGSGNSGSGNNRSKEDDGHGSGNSGTGHSNTGSGNNGQSPLTSVLHLSDGDLYLIYSNGWKEEIVNGRYILTDPKGRTVSKRRAKQNDVVRMRAAAGN